MAPTPAERLQISRPWAERRLAVELSRAARFGRGFSIGLLDIDGLGEVNEAQGYEIGDLVLGQFAELIAAKLRLPDEGARWDDDEFLVIFPEIVGPAAVAALERVRRAASRVTWGLDGEVDVRFSAGIACLTAAGGGAGGAGAGAAGAAALVGRAREALNAAKAAGGGRILAAGAIPAPRLELITS